LAPAHSPDNGIPARGPDPAKGALGTAARPRSGPRVAGGQLFGFDPGLERPEESYVLGLDPDLGRRGPAKGSVRSGLLDGGIEPVMLHALYR